MSTGVRWSCRGLGVLLAIAATQAREPYLHSHRPLDVALFVVLALPAAALLARARDWGFGVLICGAALWVGICEARFWWAWYEVRSAPRAQVESLAAHLMVGFEDWEDARDVALDVGVGGLFVSAHNVRGGTASEIARRIAGLQQARREQGLPPLLVAADQEGGVVSRLSPPLPEQPPLGELVNASTSAVDLEARVRAYASEQARGLRALGISVNLAPVLDLNHGVVVDEDRYTRVYSRALSADPRIAAEVEVTYCDELERGGVRCTAKHFPGLGRVVGDTHLRDAALRTPYAELAASDWIPFRATLEKTGALLMVGHARLSAVDDQAPASLSPRVLAIVRRDWGFDGVLISDDLTMTAARESELGLTRGPVQSLAGGMDVLLISYDPDLLWPVLAGLLRAVEAGELSLRTLDASRARIMQLTQPSPQQP